QRTELVTRRPGAYEGTVAIGVAGEDLPEPARGFLITVLGERGSGPTIGSGAPGEQRGGQERHQSGVPLSHGSDIAHRTPAGRSRPRRRPSEGEGRAPPRHAPR